MNQQFHSWVYPKKMKTVIQKNIFIPMFKAVLFIIAQIENINVHQQKNGKKGGGIFIYNGILLSQKKTRTFCHLQQHGWIWRYYA